MGSLRKPTVLITNDDGPLSDESPFIETFVCALQNKLGWNIKVCIPACQRSWIAKAFLVNQPVVLKELKPSANIKTEKGCWYTASGTPASCVNIALNHLFPDVDLVISGPNLGSNVANTCAVASGTLGGAIEAAIDGRKAIALSFAFFNRDISDDKVQNACSIACSIIEKLWISDAWKSSNTSVFNINIPLVTDPEPPIYITKMGTSRFGSLYTRLEDVDEFSSTNPVTGLQVNNNKVDESNLSKSQKQLRLAVDDAKDTNPGNPSVNTRTSVDGEDGATYVFSASVAIKSAAAEGTDIWAVHQKAVSITPLKPELHSLGNSGQASLWSHLGFIPLE
ncbi:sure-like protein [Coemansia reversa NRRL 1564]|uniref:Sure-like protein n=1 Tax=Coemansia reversa (strain ATCC 12441 / NRRL 1564) TaxID=763665 RepID=A0A2G5BEG4_COERN|nr:sure-like protein [Coemansia reversa NRRL 1564]|eukprot:PIA17408.1 sure-like protein [Coemansia reversa NRRL 1564]